MLRRSRSSRAKTKYENNNEPLKEGSQEVKRLEHDLTAPGGRAGLEPGPQTQVPVLAFPGSFWDSRKFRAPWRNLKVTGAQGHNWVITVAMSSLSWVLPLKTHMISNQFCYRNQINIIHTWIANILQSMCMNMPNIIILLINETQPVHGELYFAS